MWVRGIQRRPGRGRDFRGGGSDRTRWFLLRPESDFVTGQIVYLGGALPMLEKFKVRRHMLRTITLLLFDHIVGSNTLLYSLSNGGYIVTVPDRRPETVCAAVERHRVELLPTSPTFLNLLLVSHAYHDRDLSSLKILTYGTEPMPENTLRRIHELFPDVRLLRAVRGRNPPLQVDGDVVEKLRLR